MTKRETIHPGDIRDPSMWDPKLPSYRIAPISFVEMLNLVATHIASAEELSPDQRSEALGAVWAIIHNGAEAVDGCVLSDGTWLLCVTVGGSPDYSDHTPGDPPYVTFYRYHP